MYYQLLTHLLQLQYPGSAVIRVSCIATLSSVVCRINAMCVCNHEWVSVSSRNGSSPSGCEGETLSMLITTVCMCLLS